MFYSQNIKIFVFLGNSETQKPVTSILTLLHVRSYTLDCFFRSLGSIKKKFDQILVSVVSNISDSFHFIPFPTSSRRFHDFDKISV